MKIGTIRVLDTRFGKRVCVTGSDGESTVWLRPPAKGKTLGLKVNGPMPVKASVVSLKSI